MVNVAAALVTGILSREKVPTEVIEAIEDLTLFSELPEQS